jgi:hypothetical protein
VTKKKVGSLEEVVRTCCFCGREGRPHGSERAWLISPSVAGLPAICPECVAAGHTIAEVVEGRDL